MGSHRETNKANHHHITTGVVNIGDGVVNIDENRRLYGTSTVSTRSLVDSTAIRRPGVVAGIVAGVVNIGGGVLVNIDANRRSYGTSTVSPTILSISTV